MSLLMLMITVMTGHIVAAEVMLAICHDYIVMRGDHGVLYMIELDIDGPFPLGS